MTDQVDLSRIWALSGGIDNPGTTKYATGWVVEIPTYQNFNYVLRGLDTNLLALAEGGSFNWQDNISYKLGSKVNVGGIIYSCITANINNNPITDDINSYWTKGSTYGGSYEDLQATLGLEVINIKAKSDNTWGSNEVTLTNNNAITAYNCSGVYGNWLLGNSKGVMVIVDVGNTVLPDNRFIAPGDEKVYRLYHEGNRPTISDIDGDIIPYNPLDNKLYGRFNTNWQEIKTATGVTTEGGVVNDEFMTPKAIEDSTYVKESYVDARVLPSGTRVLFYQAAPPTGWTNLNINDYMLRAVSTGGGTTGGSDSPINWTHEHTTQGHKLTAAEMPNHNHISGLPESDANQYYYGLASGLASKVGFKNADTNRTASPTTSNTGGNGNHYHGNTSNISFTPKYANTIICSKD